MHVGASFKNADVQNSLGSPVTNLHLERILFVVSWELNNLFFFNSFRWPHLEKPV